MRWFNFQHWIWYTVLDLRVLLHTECLCYTMQVYNTLHPVTLWGCYNIATWHTVQLDVTTVLSRSLRWQIRHWSQQINIMSASQFMFLFYMDSQCWMLCIYCKKKRLFWPNLVASVSCLFCSHWSPTACFTLQKFLDSPELVNVMGECFDNENLQWCGKVWNWGNHNGSTFS